MSRPMVLLAGAWFFGMLLSKTDVPDKGLFLILFYGILFLIFFLLLRRFPNLLTGCVMPKRYGKLTIFLIFLPIGSFLALWRQEAWKEEVQQKAAAWEQLEADGKKTAFVEGTVGAKEQMETAEGTVSYRLKDCVVLENTGEIRVAGDCMVYVEGEGKEWLPMAEPGHRVKVYGTVSLYRGATNPGQFDAEGYYRGKGLYASVRAFRVEVLHCEKKQVQNIMVVLKRALLKSIKTLYAEKEAGILSAMLLGEKELLLPEIKQLYQQNGISHILAISGLHISMLCMGLFRLLRRVGTEQKLSVFFGGVFLVFYVLFTGAGTSSVRAGIMCGVLLLAGLLRRSYDLLSSLSFAAILVTAIRPGELTEAGFLLSFSAVLGVAMAQEAEEILEIKKGALFFGIVLQLFTMPVLLWFFYELSPYSIFLNLLIVPLCSLILGGGILSILLALVIPFAGLIPAGGVGLLLRVYEWLGIQTQKLPYSFLLTGRPATGQILLYYAGLFLLFATMKYYRQKKVFFAGILTLVVILFFPQPPQEELLFLDVSQGDGILIETKAGEHLLMDCGSSDVSEVGKYRLTPVLKQKGICLLDTVLVSHMDGDHVNGIRELLLAMPVYHGRNHFIRNYDGNVGIAELILPKVAEPSKEYRELVALAQEKQVTLRYLEAGDTLYQKTGMRMECLWPKQAEKSENDTSLVLLLQTGNLMLWLMGDAGVEAEDKLLERLPEERVRALSEGKQTVLKVGHHGSKTSTGEQLLSMVDPEYAVISCGQENRYGHPNESVLKALKTAGTKVMRTDRLGAVRLYQKDGRWHAEHFRNGCYEPCTFP